MRAQQVVAERRRADLLEEGVGGDGVVERLGHLLPVRGDQAVVDPVSGELVAGRDGLCQLVLVMGESKIESAAMDVEHRAEVAAGHCRALNVPSWPPGTPWRRPGCGVRLGPLGSLPEREVSTVSLGDVNRAGFSAAFVSRLRHGVVRCFDSTGFLL